MRILILFTDIVFKYFFPLFDTISSFCGPYCDTFSSVIFMPGSRLMLWVMMNVL